ncbi:MAG: hypothetical protein FWD79_07395 [Desulfobulbus sp.]|nr:hypothetical protein [Desulfobulbus sp.]
MRTVTAADAKQFFWVPAGCRLRRKHPRRVARTSIAKIGPADEKTGGTTAKESLLLRLSRQKAIGRHDWTRNDLDSE